MPSEIQEIILMAMASGATCLVLITWLVTRHFQRLALLRQQAGREPNQEVREAIEQVKRQVAELRDTTTRYDLSFDSALQRIESRVGQLEARVVASESLEASQSAGARR